MNKLSALTGAIIAASIVYATQADAAVTIRNVAIQNAGFEDWQLLEGQYSNGSFSGWTTEGSEASAGFQHPSTAVFANVPEGVNVGYVTAYDYFGEQRAGSMFQTLSEAIEVGTDYTVSVDVGRRPDVATLGPWTAELLANGAVVATGTLSDGDVAAGAFKTLSFGYTGTAGTAGQTLGIRFRTFYNAGQPLSQVNFDNVRLTATHSVSAVPEPAAWAMMISGFGVIGTAMRRRRPLPAR